MVSFDAVTSRLPSQFQSMTFARGNDALVGSMPPRPTFVVTGETVPFFPKLKLANQRGEVVFNALDTDSRWRTAPEPGTYTCTAWIPPNLLNEGVISVDVTLASFGGPSFVTHLNMPGLVTFHVRDPGLGDTAKGLYTGELRGGVLPLLEWTTDYVEARAYETA